MNTANLQTITAEEKAETLKTYATQLAELQGQIVATEKLVVEKGKTALKLAYQAGCILNSAQALVEHGNWEKWVADNVEGISKKTCENYMRLASKIDAQKEAIDVENKKRMADGRPPLDDTKTLLDEFESLKDAYNAFNIIKNGFKKEKVQGATGGGTSSKSGDNTKDTAEELRKTDIQKYIKIADEKKAVILSRAGGLSNAAGNNGPVSNEITNINWKLSTWKIEDNLPFTKEGSSLASLSKAITELVMKRDYKSTLISEEEIQYKLNAVLNEVFVRLITTNTKVINKATERGTKKYIFNSPVQVVSVEPPVAHGEVALAE